MELTAIITAVGALLVGIGGVISAVLLYRKTVSLLEYRMSEVEKRLDTHNHYAAKLEDIKDSIGSIKTDVAVMKNELSHR